MKNINILYKKVVGLVIFMASIASNADILVNPSKILGEAAAREVQASFTRFAASGFSKEAEAVAIRELQNLGLESTVVREGIQSLRAGQRLNQVTSIVERLSQNAKAENWSVEKFFAKTLQVANVSHAPRSALETFLNRELTLSAQSETSSSELEIEQRYPVSAETVNRIISEPTVNAVYRQVKNARGAVTANRVATLIAQSQEIAKTNCVVGKSPNCFSLVTDSTLAMAKNHTDELLGSKWLPLAYQVSRGFEGEGDYDHAALQEGLFRQASSQVLNADFRTECLITGGANSGL